AGAGHHGTVVAAPGDTGAAGEPCALIDALSGGISGSFTPRKEVVLVASDPLVPRPRWSNPDASHTTGARRGARPSPRATRRAPGSARPPGAFPTATPVPASRHRAGGSAISSAGPP